MSSQSIDIEIIWKKLNSVLSEEEEKEFSAWLESKEEHRVYFQQKLDQHNKNVNVKGFESPEVWQKISGEMKRRERPVRRYLWLALPVIIGILLIAFFPFGRKEIPIAESVAPVVPGSDKAILITSGGESIELNPDHGIVLKENDVSIESDGRSIVYENGGENNTSDLKNTLIIPRGGKFSLVLADGTKVWINSDSRLEYPIEFNGNERLVRLTGEAYFDVTPDKDKPFKVISNDQEIAVLGTSFNVNAYEENDEIFTTLVEGKVRVQSMNVKKTRILKPGFQSVYNKKVRSLEVNAIDVDLFVSWKDGWFVFENERLEEILETLSRWYDVDVFFVNSLARNMRFTGDIERVENIETILSLIEKTNAVKIEIKNRAVIVR